MFAVFSSVGISEVKWRGRSGVFLGGCELAVAMCELTMCSSGLKGRNWKALT